MTTLRSKPLPGSGQRGVEGEEEEASGPVAQYLELDGGTPRKGADDEWSFGIVFAFSICDI